MNKLKVNRKHFVVLSNIEKLVKKKNGFVWVYRRKGYPKIYICREGWNALKNRLTNLGYTWKDFVVEEE